MSTDRKNPDPEITVYAENDPELDYLDDCPVYRGWRCDVGVIGHRGVCVVHDTKGEPLPPRFDLRNKSPTGFEWGYCGSGPAQLALAILADAVGPVFAERLFQHFKFSVVCSLPHDGWVLTLDDVVDWVELEIAERAQQHLDAVVRTVESLSMEPASV